MFKHWFKYYQVVKTLINKWFVLFVITMLIPLIISKEVMHSWYGQGLFVWIRWLYDGLGIVLPFPTFYLIIGLLVFGFVRFIKKVFLYLKSNKWTKSLFLLLKSIAVLLVSFYWLWGFNYFGTSFFEKNNLIVEPVDFDWVEGEYYRVLDSLNYYANHTDPILWEEIDREVINQELEVFIGSYFAQFYTQPQVKEIIPNGLLMRLGAQGIYLPWSGQGQIDAGLLDIQKPFTYLHEMAHCYGITNEGECNFIAYQVGKKSRLEGIRYAAYFAYWRYLARQMIWFGCYDESQVSDRVLADLKAIFDNYDRYPDLFPRFRVYSYDLYLKAQGIEAGMKSYSEIVMMNHCWENRMK